MIFKYYKDYKRKKELEQKKKEAGYRLLQIQEEKKKEKERQFKKLQEEITIRQEAGEFLRSEQNNLDEKNFEKFGLEVSGIKSQVEVESLKTRINEVKEKYLPLKKKEEERQIEIKRINEQRFLLQETARQFFNIGYNTSNQAILSNSNVEVNRQVDPSKWFSQMASSIIGASGFSNTKLFSKFTYNGFITWRPYELQKLLLQNKIVADICNLIIKDSFSEFELIKRDENLDEDLFEEIKEEFAIIVNQAIDGLCLNRQYGGAVIGTEIENDKLKIYTYNRWEVSFSQNAKESLKNSNNNEFTNRMNEFEKIGREIEDKEEPENEKKEKIARLVNSTNITEGSYVRAYDRTIFNKVDCIILKNEETKIPHWLRAFAMDWGFSFFDSCSRALENFMNAILDYIPYMTKKGRIDHFQVKGLMNLLSNEKQSEFLGKYSETLKGIADNNDTLLTDTESNYQMIRDNVDLGMHFDTQLKIFLTQIRVPTNKFTNLQGGSLVGGSSGDNQEEREWRKQISEYILKYKYVFDFLLDKLLMLKGVDKKALKLSFEKKVEMSFEQKEAYKTNKIQSLINLKNAGVISIADLTDNLKNDEILNISINNQDFLEDLSQDEPKEEPEAENI